MGQHLAFIGNHHAVLFFARGGVQEQQFALHISTTPASDGDPISGGSNVESIDSNLKAIDHLKGLEVDHGNCTSLRIARTALSSLVPGYRDEQFPRRLIKGQLLWPAFKMITSLGQTRYQIHQKHLVAHRIRHEGSRMLWVKNKIGGRKRQFSRFMRVRHASRIG